MTGIDQCSTTINGCLSEKSPKVTVKAIVPYAIMCLLSAFNNLVDVVGLIGMHTYRVQLSRKLPSPTAFQLSDHLTL